MTCKYAMFCSLTLEENGVVKNPWRKWIPQIWFALNVPTPPKTRSENQPSPIDTMILIISS